jgi:arylsulfatase
MYDPAKMVLPVYREREISTLASPAWAERGRFDGAQLDEDRLRRLRALYYGQITHIDDGVGRILAELERQGLADNTVILFASDHGEMLGDHGLAHKSVPYEGSVRVPFLLRWPGRTEAGHVSRELVGLTDIFPTVLDGLGLRYPGGEGVLDGRSLFGPEREAWFSEFGQGRTRWVMARTRKHKYVIWAAGGREELYDLESDPEERVNLAAREKALCERMREMALGWEKERGMASSFEGGRWRVHEEPPVPRETPRNVVINEGRWPENLPEEEKAGVESYAAAFTRAIRDEASLRPEKLSLGMYKQRGGQSLEGTPWAEAWRRA